jgi:hypothetical protein
MSSVVTHEVVEVVWLLVVYTRACHITPPTRRADQQHAIMSGEVTPQVPCSPQACITEQIG